MQKIYFVQIMKKNQSYSLGVHKGHTGHHENTGISQWSQQKMFQ